jgi:hypothetical protein
MHSVDYFYKKAKDILGHTRDQSEDQRVAALREHLVNTLRDYPKELVFDVFQYYVNQHYQKPEDERSLYDLAESYLPVLSFFLGEPLADEKPFSPEEWSLIREAVNASAEFMDLDQLNALVAVLVEKGEY